jgi:hypothetical protein
MRRWRFRHCLGNRNESGIRREAIPSCLSVGWCLTARGIELLSWHWPVNAGFCATLIRESNHDACNITSGPPLARLPLDGAHGVWWDAKSSRLWALGTQELLRVELIGAGLKTQLRIEARFALPTPGGHDLSPTRDGRSLLVSSDTHVYGFDLATDRFSPYEPLRESPGIKSVHEHPTSPAVVYHQATESPWWSDRIRFIAPERTIHLPNQRIYKVRWDIDQGVPR